MMSLYERIVSEINAALKQFGEYSYGDKGPGEVMDTAPLISELKAVGMPTCKEILTTLAAGTQFESQFAGFALMELQDLPEKDFDFLLDEPALAELF